MVLTKGKCCLSLINVSESVRQNFLSRRLGNPISSNQFYISKCFCKKEKQLGDGIIPYPNISAFICILSEAFRISFHLNGPRPHVMSDCPGQTACVISILITYMDNEIKSTAEPGLEISIKRKMTQVDADVRHLRGSIPFKVHFSSRRCPVIGCLICVKTTYSKRKLCV